MSRRAAPALLATAVLALGTLALQAQAGETGRTPRPVIERAVQGKPCVEPAETMRRNHMEFLKHQRDETVHGGIRGARYSLKDCIECHASAKTQSVAKAESNFCVSCHVYAAVKIDCFECHSTKPTGKAHAAAGGAPK